MRRALDLFCGAGGASKGLAEVFDEVRGIDLHPQPNYPFEFFQQDVLSIGAIRGFDFVWASPPCQAFTAYKRRAAHVRPVANLIPAVREMLLRWGGPFVIENVEGARAQLETPVMLCGSMFGLDVRRHRLFEAHGFTVDELSCLHRRQTPRFAPATNRTNLRSTVEVGVWRIPLAVQQKAMGINWMTRSELSQAIPPAYAEYIAHAVVAALDA